MLLKSNPLIVFYEVQVGILKGGREGEVFFNERRMSGAVRQLVGNFIMQNAYATGELNIFIKDNNGN